MATERQKELRRRLRVAAPRIPMADAETVLEAAAARHLRSLPPSIALSLALVAHVRHAHTDYDRHLDEGLDRDAARWMVRQDMEEVLGRWGAVVDLSSED